MSIPIPLLNRAIFSDRRARANEGGYIPLPSTMPPPHRPWPCDFPSRLTRGAASTFSALILGVLVGIFIGFNFSFSICRTSYGLLPPPPPQASSEGTWTENHVSIPTPHVTIPQPESPSLEELRDMVSSTRGYWARDYSLQLGWNNVSDLYFNVSSSHPFFRCGI